MTARGSWRGAATLVAVVALVVCGTPGPPARALPEDPFPSSGVTTTIPAGWPEPPPVTAPAYLVVDAATGQPLAARAADELRPVASTVKILTVLTALQDLDLDQIVTVGPEVTVPGAGVGLAPGDAWTVGELVDGVLARSGNDAARALAVAAAGSIDAFVARMHGVAEALGLDTAVLEEPTGLDDTNRLSARHLAVAAAAALHDPRIRSAAARPTVTLPGQGRVASRNELLGALPGATGLKTGYTDAAGYGVVASARRDGVELIAVVLGTDGESVRFDEAARLLEFGFGGFDAVATDAWTLARAGGEVVVDSGVARAWVPAGAGRDVEVVPPVDVTGTLTAQVATTQPIVTVTASATDPAAPAAGIGAALTDALYRSMRAAHRAGLRPGTPAAATAATVLG